MLKGQTRSAPSGSAECTAAQLKAAEADFKDGCLTEKGFVKKKWNLLESHLGPAQKKRLSQLQSDFDGGDLGESSFLTTAKEVLGQAEETVFGGATSSKAAEAETEEAPAKLLPTKRTSDASSPEASPAAKRTRVRSRGRAKSSTSTPTRQSSRRRRVVDNSQSGSSSQDDSTVPEADDSVPPAAEVKEALSPIEEKMDTSDSPVVVEKDSKPQVVDSEVTQADTEKPDADTLKPEAADDSDTRSQASQDEGPARCPDCHQLLDSPTLKTYGGDPDNAVDEFVALADPQLCVFEDDGGQEDINETPSHRLTDFTVYDKQGHVCPFDGGLIERNVELFFSGVVKPIYDDTTDVSVGVLTARLGPIDVWWTAGFDGGDSALIGFSTAYADYYLTAPSKEYEHIMSLMVEKIYMSKLVIEFLEENPHESYEDLVDMIQFSTPPKGCNKFSEDTLLRHAQFVVEQVENYDTPDDAQDSYFVLSPCIRALIRLAGVTLGGKRRGIRRPRAPRAPRPKKEKKIASASMAVTTPLVRNIFDVFFQDQIDGKVATSGRRERCNVCEACRQSDCGKCPPCRTMTKFGGDGKSKQCCVQRRCPYMELKAADEDEDLAERKEQDGEDVSDKAKSKQKRPAKQARSDQSVIKTKVQWVGEPAITKGKKKYYKKVLINDEEICVGDCVALCPENPTDPHYIALVAYMWDNEGSKTFHAVWLSRGSESILGEAADPGEVFLVDQCDDNPLGSILFKCALEHRAPSANWRMEGGEEEAAATSGYGDKKFFYQKWYDLEAARFEDPPADMLALLSKSNARPECVACTRQAAEEQRNEPTPGSEIKSEGSTSFYSSFAFEGDTYSVGSGAYFLPTAFSFKYKAPVKKPALPVKKESVDEELYPEYYRKTWGHIKGSNLESPEPFRIARILQIFSQPDVDTLQVRVQKFYRPENAKLSDAERFAADWNILYSSVEECVVSAADIQGSCSILHSQTLTVPLSDYSARSTDNFYFEKEFDGTTKEIADAPKALPESADKTSEKSGKGTKGRKSRTSSSGADFAAALLAESEPTPFEPLRSLDVFAGCGGLSEGFHQSGIAKTVWAIEKDEAAAEAFKLNNKKSIVFTDDCNELLRLVMSGRTENKSGQPLPQKGEVDLLCGGPPCQGFSGMNRFNSREYSQFKNSLVSSYLSYCDYYRPRFFVLENVRNFVSYKQNMVLKLTLRCLLRMGYQCTFGILQAGSYGVPQTRRRAIIMAAAPGEKLPRYPEPTHVFSPRACQLSVMVDDKKYCSNISRAESAPYHTVTVRDAISDLPAVTSGASKQQITYSAESKSPFQRVMRGDKTEGSVGDHICKDMSALVVARMELIPTTPGADWRDLPNKVIKLNGENIPKLRYTHPDRKNGRSSTGAVRGVCSCANGKACDPADRQFNTLVPWCLPHTGNRHNHWAGLYGRLEWDGFFSTTITNPEPMGKQGRVLHPEQNRVVTVRECARSQGFPDWFRFYGNILDRHRQVGNAVPPPMAAAIGREILRSVRQYSAAAAQPVSPQKK
ncbi:DNA (cytosine-5)-methyltransferase 1-like [Sycon ciliatum]|uniref:DNA (cytosine-5)-methyltransferase 1-like n=1 Tax=Sycon ciliatum TaxID=27933 RepID=UPI0031F6AF05|eukprot:scpid7610/ scgid33757/ DNA (cytosine-5)-methyltransferase PliMCI; DNA methyltransferase PliMCI; Dnmt1; MCMT